MTEAGAVIEGVEERDLEEESLDIHLLLAMCWGQRAVV